MMGDSKIDCLKSGKLIVQKNMKKFILILLILIHFGCSTYEVKYNRNEIVKKYSAKYKTFIDNENLDLEAHFLDRDNIKKVVVNKKTKELKITQINKVVFFELKNLNLDSLSSGRRGWNKKKIDLIIIDGIPLSDSLKSIVKIDPNAIKSLEFLSKEKLVNNSFCKEINGDLLVITTK
jgi:hypothetical protein